MPNYQNGKIYKLICSETDRVYIGSTTTKLKYRKLQHIHSNNKCTSKDFINAKIYLIEDYPCNSKLELHNKEREYIENTDCVNKKIPGRTGKESSKANYEKNKKELNKKSREYHEDNKEELNKKAREKMTCECGGKFTRANKSIHFKTKKHQIFTIKNLT